MILQRLRTIVLLLISNDNDNVFPSDWWVRRALVLYAWQQPTPSQKTPSSTWVVVKTMVPSLSLVGWQACPRLIIMNLIHQVILARTPINQPANQRISQPTSKPTNPTKPNQTNSQKKPPNQTRSFATPHICITSITSIIGDPTARSPLQALSQQPWRTILGRCFMTDD